MKTLAVKKKEKFENGRYIRRDLPYQIKTEKTCVQMCVYICTVISTHIKIKRLGNTYMIR